MLDSAASCTYLPIRKFDRSSRKDASQVPSRFSMTDFHAWPGISQIGIGASCATLMVTKPGTILVFSLPACGCSPRPRKIPGASMPELPVFSRLPLNRAYLYFASSSAAASFSIRFSSAVRAFLYSRYRSTCSRMCLKSKSSKLSTPASFGNIPINELMKFYLTVSFSAKSLAST